MKTNRIHYLLCFCFCALSVCGSGQQITGVWKGRINGQKAEVKIIRSGDSLTGTSYYYESAAVYRRYSIKGYYDEQTNETVWWDDQLLDEKSGRIAARPGLLPLVSRADFNCPGNMIMKLDGHAVRRDDPLKQQGEVHLDKNGNTRFPDEWDFIIDNYTVGANDPELIDSVASIAMHKPVITPVEAPPPPRPVPAPVLTTPKETVKTPPASEPKIPETSIEDKFRQREKTFVKEIQLEGDSVELRFYDNAEIDGDSISLFLNNTLLKKNIRLTASAWVIKIAVNDLQQNNELVMVAENMGSIPPNTSYMQAIINGQRHEAWLASTEGSSAMIRLVKK